LQVAQNALQVVQVHPVRFHADAARLDPVALQDAQVNEVAGVFHQHQVAGVAQRLGEHIEELLRAVGDDHPLRGIGGARGGLFVLPAQMLAGELPQGRVARRGAVLQGGLAGLGRAEDFAHQPAHFLPRQGFVVGEPGGQGNQLRPAQRHGQQPGDGRVFGAAAQSG